MSLYQEYQKRKNERTQSAKTSAPASSSLLEAYKDKKMAEAFKNGTAGKEIDAVLGRYGNAVSSYYDAAKGQIANRDIYTFNPDASAWNEQSKRALSGIGLLRQDVEGVLSKYSKYLDEDYLNKVYEGLDSDAKSYGDIAEAYRGQSEFYSSFGGERDFGVWANNQKKISAYDSLKENTDFDEEALRGASMGKNLPWDEMLQTGGSLTGNSVASIRTAYQSALAEAETNPTAADWVKRFETDGDSLYGYSFAVNMTDEEAKMYNYLFATEGEQSATEYLRAIEEQVNYRSAQKKYEQVVNSNFIDQLGFVAGTSFAQNIGDLADAFDTSKDYYTPSAGEMALGKVGQHAEELGGGHKFAFDMVQTTANMAPSILTSIAVNTFAPGAGQIVGAGMMGLSAKGSAYKEMINNGYSKDQAQAYSVLIGASETVLQYFLGGIGSVGKKAATKLGGKALQSTIGKVLPILDNVVAQTAIKLGGDLVSEGLEEALQTQLEPIFKSLITGEEYDPASLKETLYSAFLGATSALLLGGFGTVAKEVGTYRTGKNIAASEAATSQLLEVGLSFDKDTEAYKLANKEMAKEKHGSYTLGRLFVASSESLTKQNVSELRASLEAQGVLKRDAKTLANAYEALVEGRLNTRQMSVLLKVDPLVHATTKVFVTQNSDVQARADALSEIANENATGATLAQRRMGITGKYKYSKGDETASGVVEIASKKDGKTTVLLENGEKVDASGAVFKDRNEALLYEGLVNEGYSVPAANAIIKAYDGKVGVETYLLGVREQYEYGALGFAKVDAEGVFSKDLDEAQRHTAYEAGRIDKASAVKSKQEEVDRRVQSAREEGNKQKKGKVVYDGDRKALDKRQKASLAALEKISAALGFTFRIFESYKDQKGDRVMKDAQGNVVAAPNGWYDPSTGEIFIDLYAGQDGRGTILFTAAHELTHAIKEWSPQKYEIFKAFLLQEYGKKGISVEKLVADQITKAKKNRRYIGYDEALEEVVADSCESFLADSNALKKIARLKAQDKSLRNKIKTEIESLVQKIRQLYGTLDPDSDEGKYVREMKDALEELHAMWTDALVDAGESYSAVGDKTKKVSDSSASTTVGTEADHITADIGENVSRKNKTVNGKFSDRKNSSVPSFLEKNRDYSYANLTSKNEMEVNILSKLSEAEIRKYQNDTSLFAKDMRDIAASANNPKNTPTKTYLHCRDLGADVLISKDSFKHGAARMDGTYIAVCKNIYDILNNSIVVNELEARETTDGGYVLLGLAESEDSYVVVRSIVNKKTWKLENFHELYAIKKKSIEKEDVGLKPPHYIHKNGFGTSSTISIADFLEFVNSQKIANSVLSLDVIDQLGSTRNFDKSMTPNLRYSDRKKASAPTFYSHMGKVVDGIKTEKVGANDVLSYLKGMSVKDEEIKWSGIEEFLEGKKSVTKKALQAFIKGSQLVIEEKMSGEDIDLRYDEDNQTYSLYDASGKVIDTFAYDEDMGGFVAESDERIYLDEHEIRDTLIVTYGKDDAPRWADYKIDGGENYRELVFKMPHSSYNNRAMRTHWGKDAKGILAHARIQDFTFADGRKMLFIEEIQSDWHNEGAKFVYEGEDVTKRYEANREKYIKKTVDRDFGKGQYALLKNKPESLSEEELDTMRSYVKELRKEWESKHTIEEYEKNRVPDAPFRKNYYEYVLKRLLRMAAEDGYDAIGWTPADIQVDRWSEDYAESYRIEYDQNIPAFLRKYGKKWGAEVGKTTLPKTKSGPTYFDENRGAEFDNLDQWKKECLRFMRSLGWPQKETENLVFEEEDGYVVMRDKRTKEEYEKVKIRDLGGSVWSMDITDSMKDSVLDEGQPLYSEKKGTSAETSVSTKTDVENVLARASAQMVQRYREDVAMVNELKAHLAEVNGKMGEQSYTRGGRSEGRLLKLRDEAIKTQNRIEILENRIARTEVSAGLVLAKKTTLARERDRVEMRDKKATLRKQIKGTVKRLDTLLTRGTKEKNVKNEQRGVVSSALALADVLFNDVVLNEDLVRNGSFSVSEREGRLLDEYRELLDKRDSIKDAIAVMESNPALTRVDYLQLDTLREDLKKVKQSIWNKNARLKDVFERVRSDYNKKTAVSLIEDLQREYQALSESKDEYISAAYSEHVYNHLDILKKSLEEDQKGVTVRAMSESQLAEMLDALRMIEYTVSKANKLFREGRAENFEEWVTESRMQIVENGKQGKDLPKNIKAAGDAAAGFLWNELKPFYAFERLGSKRLQTLFWDILEGEQRAAVIQENAKVFIEEKRKQYGISDDVLGKTETFVLADGSTFTLNISDMMSIYAYSKREQAMKHMLEGGFVFGNQNYYKKTVGFIKKQTEKMDSEKAREIINKIATVEYARAVDAKPQTLSEGMLNTIIEEIKKDAKLKGFADALQDYMTDLGRAGNETSRVLYGIDLFNEKHYIPIRSSKDYMNHVAMEMGQTVTSASVANMGMTRKTVPKANNPIVLESFVELFSDHTRQMSNYVGLAVPIDNMRRVLTFVSRASSEQNATSTLALIESHFSKGAKSYFDQYLRDVNGNAVKPSGYQSPLFEQFGRSKKVAVAASLSVAVQQPTSILRAGAEIDPKYLLHSMGNIHVKSTWKELKKHAPIAIIKEIGGFDVGDAGRANRYISGKQTFMTKADDVFTTLATLGDEYGWGVIWSAVKKEAADTTKLKPGTDAFFEHCRKRFTEIIVKTQVYDSVNARSGMMRSQSDIVKMGTSFMGEPTVIVNQLESAAMKVIKTKGKDKAALKHAFYTVGSLLASGALGSALKSIIYAMRDDDEDEAFWEKYLQALGRSIASDINPLNWLPFMRDVVSMIEGWSVEQADLTLLADVVTSATKVASTLIKGEDITLKQFLDLLGALGNMLGLPVKNLIREVGGLIRMAKMVFIDDIVVNDAEDLLTSFWRGGVMSSLVGELTESEKLYDALRDHDEARLDYYKKDFEKRDVSYDTKVKRAIKEQYVKGNISANQAKNDLAEYLDYDLKKDKDELFWILRQWTYDKDKDADDEDYQKYGDFYAAVESGKNLRKTIKFYTDNGVEESTLAANITSKYRPLYKEMSNRERAAIKGYLLNAYVMLGYDRAEKSKDIDAWLKKEAK